MTEKSNLWEKDSEGFETLSGGEWVPIPLEVDTPLLGVYEQPARIVVENSNSILEEKYTFELFKNGAATSTRMDILTLKLPSGNRILPPTHIRTLDGLGKVVPPSKEGEVVKIKTKISFGP